MSDHRNLRQVLLATDFSPAAETAAEHAAALARRHGAGIVVVHALSGHGQDQEGQPAAAAELERRVERLRALGIAASGVCRPEPAARAILEQARQVAADLIVVGTHGQSGWRRLVLGSTTRRVIEHAACPVLAVHQGDAVRPDPPRVYLLATDFSAASRRAALRAAEILPLAAEDQVLLCHSAYLSPIALPEVAPLPAAEILQMIQEAAGQSLEKEVGILEAAGIACRSLLLEGYPPQVMAMLAADLGAAAIVAGSVGRTGLDHLLIGSTAERIAVSAACPVLVVPPAPPAAAAAEAAAGG